MGSSILVVNNRTYQLARNGATSFPLNGVTYQTPPIDTVVEQTFTVTNLTGTVGPPATTQNAVLRFTSINTDVPISVTITNPSRATIYVKVSNSTFTTTDCPNSTNIVTAPNGWFAVASGSPFSIAPQQYLGIGFHCSASGTQTITLRSHVDSTPTLLTLSPTTWTFTGA